MTSTRFRLAYRHYLHHPWQFFLSVLGVGLGVAVVLAIDLTNASAKRGFALANQAIAGNVTHQIFGAPKTIDETVYRDLRVLHGFTEISPVVVGEVSVADDDGRQRRFQLLGIDPLAFMGTSPVQDSSAVAPQRPAALTPLINAPGTLLTQPNAVILLRGAADTLGISAPAKVAVRIGATQHTLNVIAIVEDRDTPQAQALRSTLITDISSAQHLLGLAGRLSRIDATLSAARAAELQSKLPRPLLLEESGTRGHAMQQMTRAFHTNLTALSLLALLIGAFLIYNSMTLAILQRRELIATLRTLGLSRYELIGLIVSEALVLGACGTLLGSALGIGLSQSLLGLVTTTINDLYFAAEVQTLAYTPWIFVKTASLGMGATVLAAIVPAYEASRIAPIIAQSRSRLETATRHLSPRLFVAGLVVAGLALATFTFSGRSIGAGFGGLFLIVMAFALMTPAFLVMLINALHPALHKMLGLVGTIAARGVLASLSRTQVAVAALAIAISTTIGVALMIGSFRAAVEHWLEGYVSADIYITQAEDAGPDGIARATIDRINALPEVVAVSSFRSHEFWRAEQLIRVYVKGLHQPAFDDFVFLGGVRKSRWEGFRNRGGVIVSESYAYHHAAQVGDNILLATPKGDAAFRIVGVYADYGSDRGIVTMHESTYFQHWPVSQPSALHVYLDSSADADTLLNTLNHSIFVAENLRASANKSIRRAALQIFDRSFAITEVLRVLTIVIAFVGILGALMAIQLERGREFAVLRANGLVPRDLVKLLLAEGGLMGLIAGLLALPLGIILAYVLIAVINRRSFGWSMQFVLEPRYLATGLALGLVAGVVASLYPAWRMARTSPATALRSA